MLWTRDTSGQSWAMVDPSNYSLCFTGQTISVETTCSKHAQQAVLECSNEQSLAAARFAANSTGLQATVNMARTASLDTCTARAGTRTQSAAARQVRNHWEMANPISKSGGTPTETPDARNRHSHFYIHTHMQPCSANTPASYFFKAQQMDRTTSRPSRRGLPGVYITRHSAGLQNLL